MVCVASALVLAVLWLPVAIISKIKPNPDSAIGRLAEKINPLFKKAWYCVKRRTTFRKCDTTFGEDVKNTVLAPLAIKAPRAVRPVSALISVVAWVMVLSTVVSLYVLLRSGLNLAVYGTCNKRNAEACTLAAASCSIGVEHPSFTQSLFAGHPVEAFRNEFTALADTIQTIPSRFTNWQPEQYLAPYASFKGGYQPGREIILEVIDPGCMICAQLFRNVEESGLDQVTNMSYLVYPIMMEGTPKFPHSITIANLLTAIRIHEGADGPAANPTDWRILEQIFTGTRPGTTFSNQDWLNGFATDDGARDLLNDWLTDFGYSESEIADLWELANSQQVADIIAAGRVTVREEIRTVTIPTLLVPGHMHRGLVAVADLKP